MSEFKKIAATKDIPTGRIRSFDVDGDDIAIANVDGKFYAFENTCPHQGVPFTGGVGALEGDTIICLMHDSAFDLVTGAWAAGPASDPLPVYEVRVEGDDILIAR